MIDIALLGLVSEQIHKHGGQNKFDWPGQMYGHAMGLLLAGAILGLLVTVFHWVFSNTVYLVLFLVSPLRCVRSCRFRFHIATC